ncbi:MAG TPA: Mpo1-like protein, partial [Burkholderiaceae bacterium]|nr:Mpo1-like protein [Burkholderiaceae bacterium]
MEHASQRQIVTLIAKYSESHLNPINELIHVICVPAIVFSILGLLWSVHPAVALALVVLSLIYYVSLS